MNVKLKIHVQNCKISCKCQEWDDYKPGVKLMRKMLPFFSFVLYIILSVPFLRNAPLGGFKKIKRASLI